MIQASMVQQYVKINQGKIWWSQSFASSLWYSDFFKGVKPQYDAQSEQTK